MNEFMIHVERIVRPIRAIDDHKDRMREELLAHLQASYEEERARQPDEAVARAKAIASLGDPALLRSELQDSVSRMERYKARFERLLSWHAPEPAWRYTLRVGALTTASFFLLALPTYLALLVFKERVADVAASVMVAMGFLAGINVFVLGFLYFKTRDSLLGAFGGSRSWLRAAGYVFASAATIEGTLLFFLWSFTGDLGDSLSLLLGRSLIAFALPLVGALVAWFRGPIELRHAEWELLEI
ncbi:MAG TPA: permease prefix domain 1-containing protein [Gemmataceae bacterium]|jgi:hypothetical protein|nr:permease prefix domain 1-containing protein [Gemmataceae bacterium]